MEKAVGLWKPSEAAEPERLHSVKATTKGLIEPNPSVCFYHGFVLGLIVELSDRYVISSNRESGFGRYDVLLEPKKERRTFENTALRLKGKRF